MFLNEAFQIIFGKTVEKEMGSYQIVDWPIESQNLGG